MKIVNTKFYTDIKRFGWIEALPRSVRPYIYLARLDRPIGVWLLLLPGLWAIALAAGGFTSMNAHDWSLMVLFAFGAVIMRAAGCVINDLWDRQLDGQVERTRARPLAAGTISVKAACIFLTGLLLAGLYILMKMNITTILLGILVMPLVVVYPLMKRVTWWPQAFLGLTFNFGVLMGWAAATGILELPALLIYAGALLWTLGYDTIYAHQDKEDDALIGVKSTALKFGKESKSWVLRFYAGASLLIAGGACLAGAYLTGFMVMACSYHLYHQVKNWNLRTQKSALATFKSNRDYGFLILLCCFL